MKKIFLLFIAATFLHSASFVSPIGFGGTQHEKDQVLSYIKEDTKKRYTEIGMGDPMTLRMMEKKNLEAFKRLTKARNKQLLQSVIRQYCNIGMCDYNTIEMMYNKQNNASQESLSW